LAFALAVGHVLVEENLLPVSVKPPAGIREGFAAVSLDAAARMSGLQVAQIRQVARELAQAEAPVVVGGASVVQTNSLDAVMAANALNILLGSVGRKGGVAPPSAGLIDEAYEKSRPDRDDLLKRLDSAQVVLLDGVNPAYTSPGTAKLLAKVATVLSFSQFLDDSTAYADLILPDHAGLESAAAIIPAVAPEAALTGAGPVVRPLYETRATEQVLADIAKKLGKEVTVETPHSAYQSLFAQVKPAGGQSNPEWADAGEFAQDCERQGGWWTKIDRKAPAASKSAAKPAVPQLSDAVFQGGAGEFPYYFQPYPSLQFGDGSGAHLPWMQELPDPASSAMWGLPVEIDPQSAAKLGLANGQTVRLVSPQGSIEAAVYVHPGAIPGVLSMAIGQGHKHYGRFASGQGANPLEIAAPVFEAQSGAFAFGATRVRIEKLRAEGGLVQFSMADREPDLHRR
jgi:anaerobic selenocysteine-containing dehydrogenase